MKKLVILGTALLALNAVAAEVQLKGGYDFSRSEVIDTTRAKALTGATVGVEVIPDNQGKLELGIGAEYKFSEKGSYYSGNNADYIQVPVYALGKINLLTTENSRKDAVYLLGRAGVAVNKKVNSEEKANTGLYLGAGVGTEFGPLSVEGIYERVNIDGNLAFGRKDQTKVFSDNFGVRVGLRLGELNNGKAPEIMAPVIIEPAKPVIKEVKVTPTGTLPFSCSISEGKCVIKGFKVDGRVPNEAEAKDLAVIANTINQFAEGGSIDFIGHTDSTGSEAYNQKLSVSRAQNVARLLKEYGLKDTVAYGEITGQGETNPMDTNKTKEGRYNNRRVELFFKNVDFTNVKLINE